MKNSDAINFLDLKKVIQVCNRLGFSGNIKIEELSIRLTTWNKWQRPFNSIINESDPQNLKIIKKLKRY